MEESKGSGGNARFAMVLSDAICSGSSGGTAVDFDDPNGDYALDLADPCDRAVAAELWEAAVRGEAGQENWRGEAIDGRTINISESADDPWQIPLEGELTVFFTSYPKTPSVDAVLADVHLRDLIGMMQVIVVVMLLLLLLMCVQSTPRETQRCSLALATIAEQFVSCRQLAALLKELDDPAGRL